MVLNEQYSEFFLRVSRVPCTSVQLQLLKEHYESHINSVRSFERAQSLHDLLRLLEKRDVLNEENIDTLRHIAENLNRFDIFPADTNIQVFPAIQRDIYERIIYMIGEEIGYRWKDFARALGIREGKIDQLEMRHREISERIRDIIVHYRSECPPNTFRTNILHGLCEARRRDLSNAVASMIDHHANTAEFRGDIFV